MEVFPWTINAMKKEDEEKKWTKRKRGTGRRTRTVWAWRGLARDAHSAGYVSRDYRGE